MLRRIQAVSVVVALLAVPLALVARGYACAPRRCTMMCCLRHKHADAHMKMNCAGASGAPACTMQCNSHKNIDYGLASPLAPTQLAEGVTLPVPKVARLSSFLPRHMASSGFAFEPFKPPRA
ncbi:MAG: hypothetical protein ACYDDI_06270 [Candidatus Acidiferrales bacterium]